MPPRLGAVVASCHLPSDPPPHPGGYEYSHLHHPINKHINPLELGMSKHPYISCLEKYHTNVLRAKE